MSIPFESAVLLTVRGTFIPQSLEAMREVHNATAGSPQGIAAARSLGDLSHNVYAAPSRTKPSGVKADELSFIDWWDSTKGIMDFFSNPQVQEQGGTLFSERDATIWMPARGSSSYRLPVPRSSTDRYLGMVRGNVQSPEHAIGEFAAADMKAQRDARRRGLISHELFIKLNTPAESSLHELLGLDLWYDVDGMMEHYADSSYTSGMGGAFAGRPQSSIWEQAQGHWSEW